MRGPMYGPNTNPAGHRPDSWCIFRRCIVNSTNQSADASLAPVTVASSKPPVIKPQTRRLRGLAVDVILQNLSGRWFADSGGSRFITFLSFKNKKDKFILEYYEQYGVDKMIKQMAVDLRGFADKFDDFEEIGIPYDTDPKFMAELNTNLEKAKYWRDHDEISMVIANFDLLRRSTDRILSTPFMKNSPARDLHLAFMYGGVRIFNVAKLLAKWQAGKLMRKCPECDHDAYVIRGGGGLSMGSLGAYCTTCAKIIRIDGACIDCFAEAGNDGPAEPAHGYRLDEIIEILGGVLPGKGGDTEALPAPAPPVCAVTMGGKTVDTTNGFLGLA